MAVIDTDKVMTVAQIVTELQVSVPTARSIVEDLDEVASINRTKFYSREDVETAVFERNKNVMDFLGVRHPSESYDRNITASENQE